jgi:hypothetical protein
MARNRKSSASNPGSEISSPLKKALSMWQTTAVSQIPVSWRHVSGANVLPAPFLCPVSLVFEALGHGEAFATYAAAGFSDRFASASDSFAILIRLHALPMNCATKCVLEGAENWNRDCLPMSYDRLPCLA